MLYVNIYDIMFKNTIQFIPTDFIIMCHCIFLKKIMVYIVFHAEDVMELFCFISTSPCGCRYIK